MRYVVLTGPSVDLSALLDLAQAGRDGLGRLMTDEEQRGLLRLERAVAGLTMPGHAPGHTRGPELDLRRKITEKPHISEGA